MIKGLHRLAACIAAMMAGSVAAQTYPTKPITIVVPFTAGGPTDTVARSLAQAMTKPIGQSVIVENVGGAGGTVGATRVKNAAPDWLHGVAASHRHVDRAGALSQARIQPADGLRDDYGLIVDTPMTMIARSDLPAKNFSEFVAYVKAKKTKMNLANAGLGAASHLCGLLFMSAIDTDITTVPFTGTADAMNALLGKQVDFLYDQTTNTTGQSRPVRSRPMR